MVTINLVNQGVLLDLIFEEEFTSIKKYISAIDVKYEIKSYTNNFPKPKGEPYLITKFYSLYKAGEDIIQVQRLEDKVIGSIVYSNNVISLYLVDVSFNTEYLLSQYAFSYILDKLDNAILFHSSSLVYRNKGILLAAKSGTGKSTHARLWRTYTDAVTLNDDKNCVAYEDNGLVLYPNPWSGKHHLDTNISAPLACVVFLYQSPKNIIKKISASEALRLLLPQIDQPKTDSITKWNFMVDEIIRLPMYYYGCNMDREAVEMLRKRLELDLWR